MVVASVVVSMAAIAIAVVMASVFVWGAGARVASSVGARMSVRGVFAGGHSVGWVIRCLGDDVRIMG